MRYVMLFGSTDPGFTAASEAEREALHNEIMEWWGEHRAAGTIVGGERLQEGTTATTIRGYGTKSELTDGPFVESKEEISGFGLIEVADLDAALALARTWPALRHSGESVEIRPVYVM